MHTPNQGNSNSKIDIPYAKQNAGKKHITHFQGGTNISLLQNAQHKFMEDKDTPSQKMLQVKEVQ